MTLLNKIYWSIVIIEVLAFLVLFVATLGPSPNAGGNDGGKEMNLVFGIILPMVVLGVVSLIYWKTSSQVLHVILLLVVTAPVALMANVWIIRPWMDQRTGETGSWYYKDPVLKTFLAAISRLDTNQVRELAKRVDINAVSELGGTGFTPLVFAVKRAVEKDTKGRPGTGRMDMVRLLLSLGAKPNPALVSACEDGSGEVMRLLLDAGADPNHRVGEGEFEEPAFFACLSRPAGLESLKVLTDRGANLDVVTANGRRPIKAAALYACWETVLFLHERGAKLDAPETNGMTVAESVAKAKENGDRSQSLQRVQELLKE